jgi:transcriptional regulator with XRE-family HTH domain
MQNTAQQQAEAIADSFSDKPVQRIAEPSYRRVTKEQRDKIRYLAFIKTPQTEIARLLGVSQPTVSRWLSELAPLDDTRDLAKQLANSRAAEVTELAFEAAAIAAEKGDAGPALEITDRLKVMEKQRDTHIGNAVQIIVNQAGQTVLAPPSALFQSNQALTGDG